MLIQASERKIKLKKLVRDHYEAWNKKDLKSALEIFGDKFAYHAKDGNKTVSDVQKYFIEKTEEFPKMKITVESYAVDGNQVAICGKCTGKGDKPEQFADFWLFKGDKASDLWCYDLV
ncbi:UNVERIFIED_CONTAM: nuclear transport factor 2 family protein [Kocuria sp. CPCC 205274]